MTFRKMLTAQKDARTVRKKKPMIAVTAFLARSYQCVTFSYENFAKMSKRVSSHLLGTENVSEM